MGMKRGFLYGNGAVQYINCGGIPDRVEVINYTDGDRIDLWTRGKMMPFTSGGVGQVFPGDKIRGDTSHAVATVREVLLASGTWAGGDAAGYLRVAEVTGTFASENISTTGVHFRNGSVATPAAIQSNIATVTAIVELAVTTILAVASVTSNGINSWEGDDTNNFKGFKIGTTVSESAKLLHWTAWFESELAP